MNQKPVSKTASKGVFLQLRPDQLLRDPNQTRQKFNEKDLRELAVSIKAEGQQQPVTITFAYRKADVDYYYIKFGERRWRAIQIAGLPLVDCVLLQRETYAGELDAGRLLKQASENDSRVGQTHTEIIRVVQVVLEEERKKRGDVRGTVEVTITRVANAFGKSRAWAQNYYLLTRLEPKLAELLDADQDAAGRRRRKQLDFLTAVKLSQAPTPTQTQIFDAVKDYLATNPDAARRLIMESMREMAKHDGRKIRGKKPRSDIDFLIELPARLTHTMNSTFPHADGEVIKHAEQVISNMRTIQCDGLLASLHAVQKLLDRLVTSAEARREFLYRGFR